MTGKSVDVLVVGAGPAGMVAGCLLARAGLKTLVVERNDNFDREFRGEILQPRFHKAMQDTGLFDHIAGYAHEEVERVHIHAEGRPIGGFNLRRLDRRTGPTWWMSQPELLQALADYAQKFVNFEIWFDAPLRKLSGNSATVEREGAPVRIDAKILIGADGRFSTVRKLGAFQFKYEYHDLEVLWFLLPRPKNYAHIFSFFLSAGHNCLILPKHPNMLQCGLILRPDELKRIRRSPIGELKDGLARAHPLFEEFAANLKDFTPFYPLIGSASYVSEWAKDGLVLIGDAAHTCSPAGGIGVAVAVETACVAAAVALECFEADDFSRQRLGRIQSLREKDVLRVHANQHRAGGSLAAMSGPLRKVVYLAIRLLSASGILPILARRMLTQRKPLPLVEKLKWSDRGG